MNDATVAAVADALLAAHAGGSALAPITEWLPGFDVPTAYRVLHEIERRRVRDGWRPVGRKIGFTNRTLWPRYGVYQPMWAHTWRETVQHAPDGHAVVSLTRMVEPRIEPEVVFGLRAALVVGPRLPLADADCDRLASLLPAFALTLRNGERVVDRGTGSNVLDGPAHALVHRARVLAAQTQAAPLAAGEFVTTGTITDAWPVTPGKRGRATTARSACRVSPCGLPPSCGRAGRYFRDA